MRDRRRSGRRPWLAAWLVTCLVVSAPVQGVHDRLLLGINVGEVGVVDDVERSRRYGIDVRLDPISRWRLVPGFGAARAEDGASFVYVDLRHDIWLDDRWALVPSFGVGSFDGGETIDLGSRLQFRSGLEVAYRLSIRHRLGLSVFHLSNGGVAERNPGTESVVLSVYLPLG